MAEKRRGDGKPIPPDVATARGLDTLAHMVVSARNNAVPRDGSQAPTRKIRKLRKKLT